MDKKLVLAAALSGIVAAGSMIGVPNAEAKGKGECHGVNGCKGKGACHGQGYSCAGNNKCGGQGWMKMTKEECQKAIQESAKKGNINHPMFYKGSKKS